MTKRQRFECNSCGKEADPALELAVFRDWRGKESETWHICSPDCYQNLRLSRFDDLDRCPPCGRLLTRFDKDGSYNWNHWRVQCWRCIVSGEFKDGQRHSAFSSMPSSLLPANLCPTITHAEFQAAGYTRTNSVQRSAFDLNQLALRYIENQEACVLLYWKTHDEFPYLYARPHPRYARAAALLLCAAQRLDRGSLLGMLPRDLILLLGKRVLVEKFAPEWLDIN